MRSSIHYNRLFSEYRQMAGLNWSILKHPTALAQRHAATQPDGEHDPIYSALHCAILEPERFAAAYQLADGRRTAARKAEAEAAGVVLLTERDMETIERVRAAGLEGRQVPGALRVDRHEDGDVVGTDPEVRREDVRRLRGGEEGFEVAYRLTGSAEVAFNVGLSYDHGGEPARAAMRRRCSPASTASWSPNTGAG